MLKQVTQFLRVNHLNLHEIHRKTHISMSTLSTTFNRPMRTWKLGIIQSLADVLHTSPSDVLDMLSDKQWKLVCNDKAHTIQGVAVSKAAYANIKSTVITECYEGWQPKPKDIKLLVRSYSHPSNDVIDSIKEAKEYVYGKK